MSGGSVLQLPCISCTLLVGRFRMFLLTRVATRLVLLLVLCALAGCATGVRPESTLVDGAADLAVLPPPGSIVASLEAAPPAIKANEINVLAISGGGSDGAFGAGVLKGWTESGTRPTFNVVTGVSTGALIASFAFLGSAWDGEIERFYTRITDEHIYAKKGVAGLFQESLYDTAPLRTLVEKAANRHLIDAVAREHRRGRRLYVATTDLDSGVITVWDMGAIAASVNPGRYETYRDVLVASAAFPGFFEPVFVRDSIDPEKTRMHVDGGVKAPILLRSFMVAGTQKKKTVYMLINGKLTREAGIELVKPTVIDISKRSISELMRGLTYKTIYQAYVTSKNARASFRMIHVPDDVRDIENALSFKPEEMRRMFEVGYISGRDKSRWLAEPPRLEPLERIAVQ